MDVIQYVVEEVRRQGHDLATRDGIERVGWMLNAWAFSLMLRVCDPNMFEVIQLGRLIEPNKNHGGLRTCCVSVGLHVAPRYTELSFLLAELLEQTDLTPLEFYLGFETIHPFIDGNGRVGKILLNWRNGTLLNPIFPPDDFWGSPIINP